MYVNIYVIMFQRTYIHPNKSQQKEPVRNACNDEYLGIYLLKHKL